MLLNTADKVYAGTLLADAVYLGDAKVWPAGSVPNPDLVSDVTGLVVEAVTTVPPGGRDVTGLVVEAVTTVPPGGRDVTGLVVEVVCR